VEVVSSDWDNEITEVKTISSFNLLLDSCGLKPRKTVTNMAAVNLPVDEVLQVLEDLELELDLRETA